jgi:hypothetical protein
MKNRNGSAASGAVALSLAKAARRPGKAGIPACRLGGRTNRCSLDDLKSARECQEQKEN